MEDSHIALTDVTPESRPKLFSGNSGAKLPPVSFFGVFDGHGGKPHTYFTQLHCQYQLYRHVHFYNVAHRVLISTIFTTSFAALRALFYRQGGGQVREAQIPQAGDRRAVG